MKKIYKIFMAVAAVAAVGCTTDATEDLGVNLNEGPTTLTLSLDDTRTQLGEKADGTYPLTWAENDAISVNGSVSKALTADEAGATSATFTFNNEFGSAPYFVAYPATSTNNQVVFAAEQTHTSNTTFGNGAAVMYGYTTDLNSVKLNHLTGVLKIGIVSGTEELTFIKEVRISTVDRKPIAGAFNATYNAETEKMELTPAEGATEVITYKSESETGFLVLPAAENNPVTYIHIAVPAGVYGELYVTLESADGVMYKVVKTDSTKPVNAGTVREFSNNIEFVPTDEAEVFVISNYSDLYEYKEAVEGAQSIIDNAEATEDAKAEATATLAKSAVLVNDIEIPVEGDVLTGKDWAPINAPAYTAEFNGNGYAIKGLYAPLFDTVAATIKGVHLKDVAITRATTTNVGALVNTYKGSNISHCSVAGKITISCKTSVENIIGGLVGLTDYIDGDMSLTDCVNNCDITVNLSNEGEEYLRLGGLFGYVKKTTLGAGETKSTLATLHTLTMSNLTNNKPVKVTGGGSAGNMYIGGIAGNVGGLYVATLTNLHNKADMTVEVDAAKPIRLAGIIAEKYNSSGNRYYHFTAKNCTNSGNIKATVKTTSTGDSNTTIAGLFGQIYDEEEGNTTLTNCDNSGNVEFYGMPTNTDLTVRVDMGGVVGIAVGRINITNCDNTGEKVYAKIGTQARRLTIGGICGRSMPKATNHNTSALNLATFATCTNKADVSCYIGSSKHMKAIGGIVGGWYCTHEYTKYRLTMNGCVNEGNLLSSCDGQGSSDSRTLIGFIGSTWAEGYAVRMHYKEVQKFEITNCRNGKADGSNTMTVTGKEHRQINAGGLIGYCYNHFTIDGCTNNMSYVYDCDKTTTHYYGGLYGRMYQTYPYETTANNSSTVGTVKLWFNVKDFTNNSNATLNVTSEKTLYASKLIGSAGGTTLFLKLGKVTCKGDLTITKKGASATYTELKVGGINAYMNSGANTLYDTSEATIAINGNLTVTGLTPDASATTNIGGAVGSFTKDLSNITVNGTVTVDEGVAAGMLAGVASTAAKTFTDCKVGGKFVEGTTETTLDSTNFAKYLFSDRVLTEYAGVTLVE